MSTDHWRQVKTVFRQALECPEDDRADFIDHACAGDDTIRTEVERLIRLHEDGDSFLETPAVDLTPGRDGAPPGDTLIGQSVGSFRLTRRIAGGGMGVVYEAEQEHPRRTVAVKVLRPGFAAGAARRRFEHEVQMLARLQHPGIAQIFEAGSFDHGAGAQPYFAMELVDGQSLTDYAETHKLSVPDRLGLLIRTCNAVQHAHQKGVVHRDLKPSNILVDRAGRPRVLDFGVARATDADVQVTTMHTSVGELIGTINYMSPEQVTGDPNEVDTRSDVYALGIVGYELLSGRLPYDVKGTSIPGAALRTIAEQEPLPLGNVDRVFRGDLETIFAKAIEKDRGRRYQSATELADDLRRYLEDEPIEARVPTRVYKLRKFTKRHRTLVAGALATLLALVLGLVLTIRQSQRALFEAGRYQHEADKAKAVTNYITNDFLIKLLSSVGEATGESGVTIREHLDRATSNVSTIFADQPLDEAAVRNELGTMYYNVGEFGKAETEFRKCLLLWERALGPDHVDTLKAVNNLGQSLGRQGEDCEALYRRALEGRLRALGEDDPFTLVSMNNLAMALQGKGQLEEAEALLTRAVQGQRRVLGPRHMNTLITTLNIGKVAHARGDFEVAEARLREGHEGLAGTLGADHVATQSAARRLAETLRRLGRLEEADALLREAIETITRAVGAQHREVVLATLARAALRADRGAHAESEAFFRTAFGARSARDASEAHVGSYWSLFAGVLREQGKVAEADAIERDLAEVAGR